jgi:hypothetical protein
LTDYFDFSALKESYRLSRLHPPALESFRDEFLWRKFLYFINREIVDLSIFILVFAGEFVPVQVVNPETDVVNADSKFIQRNCEIFFPSGFAIRINKEGL